MTPSTAAMDHLFDFDRLSRRIPSRMTKGPPSVFGSMDSDWNSNLGVKKKAAELTFIG
jgi:hypothetical protein